MTEIRRPGSLNETIGTAASQSDSGSPNADSPAAGALADKSSVAEIRARFDADVERFSNLETGQTATMDAPLCLRLIAEAAAAATPQARRVLDVGCGAGNYALKLLDQFPQRRGELQFTLLDLSRPMLDRAAQRLQAAGACVEAVVQADVREADFPAAGFDVILAAQVLHHLRTDDQWQAVLSGFYRQLAPGGSLWIFDLVEAETPALQRLLWDEYGRYLVELKGPSEGAAYRDHVFAYIAREDSPRPLTYQLDLLRKVGFGTVEVLHKRACFAAFGAVK